MTQLIASSELTAVIGMGATGLSVARFLTEQKQRFIMFDTRQAPPNLERFKQEYVGTPYELGELSADSLSSVSRVVPSPGVSLREAAIQRALEKGIPVIGDIQLFVDQVATPVVAITGSNGKSTVTTLVGEMMKSAGRNVAVGGNLGRPALDLLTESDIDSYVLELSSFQLETTTRLNAKVACILNVSADHMDRYRDLPDYHAAKQRIYFGAEKIVVNREDPLTQPPLRSDVDVCSFGLDKPDLKQFGLVEQQGELWLAFGLDSLMPVRELKLTGKHNAGNALAALAIGYQSGIPMAPMLETLRSFAGLPHRCQWVASKESVDFINDSKGTNAGATLAALHGLSRPPNKIVLIAGGDGKGADFTQLGAAIRQHVGALVSIGRDGDKIAAVAEHAGVPAFAAATMEEAVKLAFAKAKAGDAVLLSPACASFDMFDDYVDRGNRFITAVNEVVA
ncbi:MAG: UDP-N-acetylmuramoyl-L-alanine--D-glutamate ligase [Cellvibrionaceae bacterium]